MAYQIQLRSDTATNWTTVDPILAQGEAGYETDTGNLKIGDGSTTWSSLPYFSGGGSGTYGNAEVSAYLASAGIGNIIPLGNNIQSLGNASNQWKDLWISNNTIFINSIPISLTSNNDLTVAGNAVVTTTGNGSTNVTTLAVSGELSANTVSASGDITGNSLTVTGNATASFFIGDGSQLTNLPTGTSYSNANVSAFLPTYTGTIHASDILTTGNIQGDYFIGNGSQLTGLPATYTDADVAAYLPTYAGVLAGSSLSVTGNVDGNFVNAVVDVTAGSNLNGINVNASGAVSATGDITTSGSVSATGNVDAANLNTTGIVSATGNVIGANFETNGNVVAVGGISGADLVLTGNITATGDLTINDVNAGGNIVATGNLIGGNVSTTGNVWGVNLIASGQLEAANISTSGTVTGGNISTAGNVYSSTSITSTLSVTGNAEIAGNLTVAGNTTYTNVSNLDVANALIYAGSNNVTNIVDQGLITPFNNGTQQYGGFVRDHATGDWVAFANVTTQPTTIVDFTNATYSNIQGGYFLGNGSQLTGLANVAYSGDYNDLINQPTIPTLTSELTNDSGFITSNGAPFLNVTGNVTAGNVTSLGSITAGAGATIIGTASAGNLTTTGFVSATGNATAANFNTTGTVIASGNITAANVTTSGQVSATGNVKGANLVATAGISSAGNVVAPYFIGDGSQLTGITSDYGNANVAAYLQVNTANVSANNVNAGGAVSAVGNITGSYIFGNGSQLTGLPAGYANANVAAYLPTYSGNLAGQNATLSGNLTASYLFGNGSQLTGLPENYGNANVAAYLPTYTGNLAGGNVSVTANVIGNHLYGNLLTIAGNTNIGGNLNVTGNLNYANVTNLDVSNPLIYAGANNVADNYDQGIITPFNNGTQQFGGLVRDHVSGEWNLFSNVVTQPTTTVDFTGAIYDTLNVGAISATGNVSANTVNVTDTVYAYNISSAGSASLTIADVSGNLSANAVLTDNYLYANGTPISFSSDYGNANVAAYLPTYGGDIGAGNINLTGNISTGGFINAANITANYFIGDGSQLSNLNLANAIGGYGNANVADYLPTYTGDLAGNTVSVTGNATAAYFIGDGSQLTGLPASYGNADVAAYLPTYTGNLVGASVSTSGNITGAYIFGNGSQLTGLPESYGNANVAAYLPTYTGNISASDAFVANSVTANLFIGTFQGNISGNLVVPGSNTQVLFNNNGNAGADSGFTYDSVTNDLTVANNINTGSMVANGNITASYFIGDGSQLTGLPASYGNSDVSDYLASGNDTTGYTTTGNVTAAFFIGNGSLLNNINIANIAGSYANSNVADYLPTYTGNLAGASVSTSGNVTGAYIFGNGSQLSGMYGNTQVAAYLPTYTGDLAGGNVAVSGNISGAWANVTNGITAGYFIGNGSQLTGVVSDYGNSNVAAYLPNYTGNIGATVISGGYISVIGDVITNANVLSNNVAALTSISTFGTVRGGNVYANVDISAAGNITGAYIFGNGSQLTGVSSYANANVAAYLLTNTGNIAASNFSATGNVTGNGLVVNGNATINGNVTISGNVDYTNVNDLSVTSPLIFMGANNTSDLVDLGFLGSFNNGTQQYGGLVRDHTAGTWKLASNITTTPTTDVDFTGAIYDTLQAGNISLTGNATATYFIGDGSLLTNIDAGNLIGGYGNGNVANYLPTFSGNISAGNASVAGNVVGGNFTTGGNVNATGNISATGNVQGSNIRTGGIVCATGNVTGGNLIAVSTISALGNVVGANILTVGYVSATGNVTGNYIIGNGALLTGLPAGYANANVAAYLPTYTGDIGAGNITATGIVNGSSLTGNIASISGNVTGGNLLTGGVISATGNITGGNISATNHTGTAVSVTGNVTASFVIGNGSLLSNINIANIAGSYANSNVADYLPTYSGNLSGGNLSVTGNIVGNNIGAASIALQAGVSAIGNVQAGNVRTTGIISATGNITSGNISATNHTGTAVSVTGNVTSGNVLTGGYVSATGNVIGGNVTTVGLISATGNITGGNLTIIGESNLNAIGNVTITGGSSGQYISTDGAGNLSFSNPITAIPAVYFTASTSGNNQTFSNTVLSAYTANTDITLFYNGALLENTYYTLSGDTLTINTPLNTGDSIDVSKQFAGNINTYTNNPYGNSNVATYLPTYTGNVGAGYINASDELTVATNNGHGGVGYAGIMTMTNTSSNVTNANKFIRLNNTGALEVVNSSYSSVILALSDSGNATITGLLSSPLKTVTANATGTVGQICWDANYIYVCVADNTWKRSALTGGF